jgi:acetylglutamate kinase
VGGLKKEVGGSTGEMLRASGLKPLAKLSIRVTSSSSHELVKGLKGAVNHTEVSAFNAKLELCNIKEWLR